MQEMGMLSAFSAIVHVSNLSLPEHLTTALEELGSFTQKELCSIAKMVEGKRYVSSLAPERFEWI